MFLQPVHERQIVGQSAHQGHRRVGVQVDQARDQDVIGQVHMLARREAGACFTAGQNGQNATFVDGDCVVGQHGV